MKHILRVGCLGVCVLTLTVFILQAQPVSLNPSSASQFIHPPRIGTEIQEPFLTTFWGYQDIMRSSYAANISRHPSPYTGQEVSIPTSYVQDLRINPNPFYQRFVLRFTLKESAVVSINLYDAKGSMVKKVPAGTLSKGPGQITVNGNGLAGGLYFCVIWINNERLIRKVVMLSPR